MCDNQVHVDQPKTHAHIVEVGPEPRRSTTTVFGASPRSSTAKARGEVSTHSVHLRGEAARVIVVGCSVCGQQIIRSSADAVTDNNLDSLPDCVR